MAAHCIERSAARLQTKKMSSLTAPTPTLRTTTKRVQVVRMSPNVVASSSKAPESGKSIECDPRRADDAKPDVGILASCAKGSQCVQSNESALGGVCRLSAQQRLLDQGFGGYAEYFCDDNSGQQSVQSPFESCDCSQLVNGVGPLNCTVYSRYCFDVDEKYCSSVTFEGEVGTWLYLVVART